MTKFEKFFSSDRLLTVSFIVAVFCFAAAVIMGFIPGNPVPDYNAMIFSIIILGVSIMMFVSFVCHETGMMHTSQGAFLIILVASFFIGGGYLMPEEVSAGIYDTIYIPVIVEAVVFCVIFINHNAMLAKHTPARGNLVLNEVISFYPIIIQVVFIVLCVGSMGSLNEYSSVALADIVLSVGRIFIFFMILGMESKLFMYKKLREEFGRSGAWNDTMKEAAKKDIFGE